jgi:putative ABC transport system permease protein
MSETDIKYPPSKVGHWLLSHIIHGELQDSALGDFEEGFLDCLKRRGRAMARLWYWGQIIKSCPRFLSDRFWWAMVIFKSYLVVSWRSLKRNKIFAGINIFGLSMGFACGIIVLLFVHNELSFDRYHENAKNIYRIVRKRITARGEEYSTITPWLMKNLVLENFPEVRNVSRLAFHNAFILEYGEKHLSSNILYADPSLLDIFSFPLIRGNKLTVLKDPSNMVLSEDVAYRLFGEEDPIGKTIFTYADDKKYAFQVSGILKNTPRNSHFTIEALVSIENLAQRYAKEPHRLNSVATYLLLDPRANLKDLENKAGDLIKRFSGPRSSSTTYSLQPLTSIYLHSENIHSAGDRSSRPAASYALSVIAFVILLIACFNFMNLSTARSSGRFREIGQRRVIGATRPQLIAQFLGESLFMASVSFFVALLLVPALLPIFNSLIKRDVPLAAAATPPFILSILALMLIVGFFAGLYPAVVLSSFKPVDVLRGTSTIGTRSGMLLRKSLIITQYALSLVLITTTIVVTRQIRFIQKKDLGFDKENIIWVSIMRDPVLSKSPQAIKRVLSGNPNIKKVIVTFSAPGSFGGFFVPCQAEGFAEENPLNLHLITAGEGYFSFFGIGIVQGHDFSNDYAGDVNSSVIINESAERLLGWDHPLGKQIKSEWIKSNLGKPGPFTVIGVVRDFHNGSLKEKIEPSMYIYWPEQFYSIYIKIRPIDIHGTLAFIENALKELHSIQPFQYLFLDDYLNRYLYESDQSIRRVFSISSVLALALCCLGVFGLVSYSADRRKKEIGIRKVLGASLSSIIRMLSKEFLNLVLMGSLLALPVAFWAQRFYLQDYAYRETNAWWMFPFAIGLVIAITLLTVRIQATKAASANPADTLRHE